MSRQQDVHSALEHNDRLARNGSSSVAPLADRRAYHQHLITLAQIPSYDCKNRFATFIDKHFKTFEDLQDHAVDAVLDFCEDDNEKIRLAGIRALKSTAVADHRWVKGNTGVLLQLLESPPVEVAEVHRSIQVLMETSPVDVIEVMADNCKGTEVETGTSRRNVLEFLTKHASEQRRRLLEAGANVEAEKAFRSGFESVLRICGADSEEGKVVGSLLASLSINRSSVSTFSGKSVQHQVPPRSRPDGPKRDRQADVITPPVRPRAEDLAEVRPSSSDRFTRPAVQSGEARFTKPSLDVKAGKDSLQSFAPSTGASSGNSSAPNVVASSQRLAKRPRQDLQRSSHLPVPPVTSSLLARMAPIDDAGPSKRVRTHEASVPSVPSGPSLRERMFSTGSGNSTVGHQVGKSDGTDAQVERSHPAAPSTVGQPVSTKLHASSSFSIKNHSNLPAMPTTPNLGLSIRSAASKAIVEGDQAHAGVIRKGRGFQKSDTLQDDLLVLPTVRQSDNSATSVSAGRGDAANGWTGRVPTGLAQPREPQRQRSDKHRLH